MSGPPELARHAHTFGVAETTCTVGGVSVGVGRVAGAITEPINLNSLFFIGSYLNRATNSPYLVFIFFSPLLADATNHGIAQL